MPSCYNASIASPSICSPHPGEIWTLGSAYDIGWNTLHPDFQNTTYLDILIYADSPYNPPIKTFQHISLDDSHFGVTIDETWFNNSKRSMVYVVPGEMTDISRYTPTVVNMMIPDNNDNDLGYDEVTKQKNTIMGVVIAVGLVPLLMIAVFSYLYVKKNKRQKVVDIPLA